MRYFSLYLFHLVYFILNGCASFVPKYYGEIGLTEGMIGLLTSVPTVVALACSPMLALLTDRVSRKRYMLAVMLLLLALACFSVIWCQGMPMLLIAISVYMIFYNSVMPLATTISLEYTREIHRDYGPIRLLGTVGYQVGALLVGVILAKSLKNLYPLMGVAALLSCATTFMMPNVKGHQHNKKKVPLSRLFADRHVRWLFVLILFATISSQFYMAFFTKHLGDLGMNNVQVSWITLLSVLAELPFLYFADRIAKKTNVWNWVLLGMLANGVRWLGLSFSKSFWPILLFQVPGVTVLACFEFFPALYLNRRVPAELQGSAQNMLTLTAFGAARIIASLLGGAISEMTSIATVMAFNGAMLLVGCAAFWKMTRGLVREDTVASLSD